MVQFDVAKEESPRFEFTPDEPSVTGLVVTILGGIKLMSLRLKV